MPPIKNIKEVTAPEGANPSWQYPYDRRHEGMAAATWL